MFSVKAADKVRGPKRRSCRVLNGRKDKSRAMDEAVLRVQRKHDMVFKDCTVSMRNHQTQRGYGDSAFANATAKAVTVGCRPPSRFHQPTWVLGKPDSK